MSKKKLHVKAPSDGFWPFVSQ